MSTVSPLMTIASTSPEDQAQRLREQVGDPAADKFTRLVIDLPGELRAVANSLAERRAAEVERVNFCTREIERLSTGTVGREHAQNLEKRVADLRRERDRHRARTEELSIKLRSARARLSDTTALAAALREGVGGKQIAAAKAEKPPRGWDVAMAQAERIAVLGQIAETENAANTPEALRAAIREALDAQVERAGVRLNLAKRGGDPANIGQHFRMGMNGKLLIGDGGAGFLLWALRDHVEAALLEMVPDDIPGAMADEQREQRLTKLRAELLRLERIEESLLERAEAEGRAVERRPDADPRAILGVDIVGGL